MSARNLARWSFFAGGTYALVWSTLWDVFDWPIWLGALTALICATIAYWLVDAGAERVTTAERQQAGRCGMGVPGLSVTALPRPVCKLPAGHAGWHRADDDCEWGQIREESA